MLKIIEKIAEQKIRAAQEAGEFDNLSCAGQPLTLDDYDRIPEEVRMAYKILKNSGFTPPEIQIKNEIIQIEDMLAGLKDEQEKYRQLKKLNYLVTKLNMMRSRPVTFDENQRYLDRIVDKIEVADKDKP